MKPISPYTRKMLRIEAFMKVLLAASALLIITALMVLIGYLSFRGLFIRHEIRSTVMPDYREDFLWPVSPDIETPKELQGLHKLRLSPSVTLGKLRADKLHDILSGKEKNWVELAESSEKLVLLLSEVQVQSIQNQIDDWNQARNIEVLPDTEAVAQALLKTPGALAILPLDWDHWPSIDANLLPRSVSIADRSLLMKGPIREAKQNGQDSGEQASEFLRMSFDEAKTLLEDSPERVQIVNYNWISGALPPLGGTTRAIQLQYREYEILKLSFLLEAPAKNGKVGGISSLLISSIILIVASLLWAIPLGLAVAVFLAEYAEAPNKKMTKGGAQRNRTRQEKLHRQRQNKRIDSASPTLSTLPFKLCRAFLPSFLASLAVFCLCLSLASACSAGQRP